MSNVSREVLDWLYSVLSPDYKSVQRTFDDVAEVLREFGTLRPKTDIYTYEDGTVHLLLLLYGTLPIMFQGSQYQIPIHVWMPQIYPEISPTMFVVPSAGMGVRPGNHVDIDRRCYHPYLAYWNANGHPSRVNQALKNLQDVFSKEPPVYKLPPRPSKVETSREVNQTRAPPIPAKLSGPQGEASAAQRHRTDSGSSASHAQEKDKFYSNQTFFRQQQLDNRQSGNNAIRSLEKLPVERKDNSRSPQQSSSRTYNRVEPRVLDERSRKAPLASSDLIATDLPKVGERLLVSGTDEAPSRGEDDDHQALEKYKSQIMVRLQEHSETAHRHFMLQLDEIDVSIGSLKAIEATLQADLQDLTRLGQASDRNATILQEKLGQAKTMIQDTEQRTLPDIDQCLVAQNAVYNQLYDLVATELSLEDATYVLGQALENERIDLDTFLKVSTNYRDSVCTLLTT